MEHLEQVKLQVTERDVVIVSSAAASGTAMLVVPQHPGLVLRINGVPAMGRCAVRPTDKLEVVLEDAPARRELRVDVSPDRMEATLSIHYEDGATRRLVPVPASATVSLAIEETPVRPQPFSYTDVEQALAEQAVTWQVDTDGIMKFLESATSGTIVCAKGQPPVEGVPAHYELAVTQPEDLSMIGIIPVQPIISVRSGAVVARFKPEQPGVPGIDVSGNAVQPQPLPKRLPALGKGVEIESDGTVRAKRSGRVVFHPATLDVAETMTIERNLRAADGYIWFDGDVIIRGDVEEGAEVVAGGQILVSGSVSRARLSADQGIVVSGGVFMSTLRSGSRGRALVVLQSVISRLSEQLDTLSAAVDQVRAALASKGRQLPAGAIALKLLEERFQGIGQTADQLRDWLKQQAGPVGSAWVMFVEELLAELAPGRIGMVADTSHWVRLSRSAVNKVADIADEGTTAADVQVRYAQNSDIEAAGNIVSTQQGFYQCKLVAGQAVRASGMPGVILACQVEAGEVRAREIGSHAETATQIHLTDIEGTVTAHAIHPGTLLSVGSWRHKVIRPMTNTTWP